MSSESSGNNKGGVWIAVIHNDVHKAKIAIDRLITKPPAGVDPKDFEWLHHALQEFDIIFRTFRSINLDVIGDEWGNQVQTQIAAMGYNNNDIIGHIQDPEIGPGNDAGDKEDQHYLSQETIDKLTGAYKEPTHEYSV